MAAIRVGSPQIVWGWNMDDVIEISGYIDWLRKHHRADIVGYAHDDICNPIATFLRAIDREASVMAHSIIFEQPHHMRNAPVWVTRHLDALDALSPCDIEITAEKALQMVTMDLELAA